MPRRPPAYLPQRIATIASDRHGIDHERLVGVDPRRDLVLARGERSRRERREQPSSLLLVPLRVRSDRQCLRDGRLDRAPVPLEAPDRKPQLVETVVDRRHVEPSLVPTQVRLDEADGALALRDGVVSEELSAFLQVVVGAGRGHVTLDVLEPAADRQRRVGLAVLEQHEVATDEITAKLEEARWIDSPLEDRRRRAPRRDRGGEGLLRGSGVGREVGR